MGDVVILRWSLKIFASLLASAVLAFFVYKISDENLSETAKVWQSENEKRTRGAFAEFGNLDLSEALFQNEAACTGEKTKEKDFLSAWQAWQSENESILAALIKVMTEKEHSFANSGISPSQGEFESFSRVAEVFDYYLCSLALQKRERERDALMTRLAFHLFAQLRKEQIASYQLWALQNIGVLSTERVFQKDKKLREDFDLRKAELEEEKLFALAKKFSFQSTINSLQQLRQKGWLQFRVWLPAMLIPTSRLSNRMVDYKRDDKYERPKANAHWADVENLENIYFSLFHGQLHRAWTEIPAEIQNLKKTTGP